MLDRYLFGAFLIAAGAQLASAQSGLTCTAQAAGTPSIRAEGHYEATGNILIACQGGTPAAGVRYVGLEVSTIPSLVPFTSRILDQPNAVTEAVLLVDDPQPSAQVVCQTPLNPAACLSANVFPGIKVSSSRLRFVFPFIDPGTATTRILRFANLRVAASQLGVPVNGSAQVGLNVSAVSTGLPSPQITLSIVNSVAVVGSAQRSLGGSVGASTVYGCEDVNRELALSPAAGSTADGRNIVVRVRETSFPSAWKKRNHAAPANGADPPPPIAQNLPGVIYQTESEFYNPAFPGIYSSAGLSASGARFYMRIHDVPNGVTLFAPTTLTLFNNGTGVPNLRTGHAKRVDTDADGAGVYAATVATSPIAGGLAAMQALGAYHQAIYEIAETDTTAFEIIDVPIYPAFLATGVASGQLNFSVGFAPLSTDLTAESSISPRFLSYSTPASLGRIDGCTSITLLPTTSTQSVGGGTGTIAVTATPSTYAWTSTSNASWITVTAGASGQGNGSVSYSVAANAGAASRTGAIKVGTATFTVNQAGTVPETITLNPSSDKYSAGTSGISQFSVNANFTTWTAVSNNSWLVVISTTSNQVVYSWAENPDPEPRTGTITVGTATFTVIQGGFVPTLGTNMLLVPFRPCRLVDTREDLGAFGKPSIAAGVERRFSPYLSACAVPRNAKAYVLNVTVVPKGPLSYITLWPTGLARPLVSTLNSVDGRIKANMAIVPAGASIASFSVYSTNATDLVIDISGYFIEGASPASSALAFYPLTPCRVLDTRDPAGTLGGPALVAGVPRSIPVKSGNCGVPASAEAYSLNTTVVPSGPLSFLTLWPSGQNQPFVSTLNALNGATVANAAILPAGTNGVINAYATNATNLVIDINGYFARQGSPGALTFNAVAPCRVLDSRDPAGAFGGPILAGGQTRTWPIPSSACGLPATAGAYSLNATVVPTAGLGHLTVWPAGQPQPLVSTLNAAEDPIAANALIAPAGAAGAISSFVTNQTHLVMDVNGFFAP